MTQRAAAKRATTAAKSGGNDEDGFVSAASAGTSDIESADYSENDSDSPEQTTKSVKSNMRTPLHNRKSIVGNSTVTAEREDLVSSRNKFAGQASARRRSIVSGAPYTPRNHGQAQSSQAMFTPVTRNMTMEEVGRNYDEWMKFAADNKINSANTWSFALIDYFHELALLKEGDSVNFQKASYTLDGCVKIYTSRVDAVDSDTKRLVNGLTETIVEDEEEDNGAEERTRKATRAHNTIAKDPQSLNYKQLDSEYTVDPLFKKTSIEFDDGSAEGMLMNTLQLNEKISVVFDAGERPQQNNDVDQEDGVQSEKTELTGEVDLALLRETFFPSSAPILDQRQVCIPLDKYDMTWTVNDVEVNENPIPLEDELLLQQQRAIDHPNHNHNNGQYDNDNGLGAENNGFSDDYNEPMEFFDGGGGDNDDDIYAAEANNDVDSAGPPSGPANSKRDGMKDATNQAPLTEEDIAAKVLADDGVDGGAGFYDYFDKAMVRNWSGSAHWKLRPLFKRKTEETQAPAKRKRTKREPVLIDFINADEPNVKSLFAKDKRGTSHIQLSKKDLEANKNNNLLRIEREVTAKDFFQLFSKPSFVLKPNDDNLCRIVEQNLALESGLKWLRSDVSAEANAIVAGASGAVETVVADADENFDDADYIGDFAAPLGDLYSDNGDAADADENADVYNDMPGNMIDYEANIAATQAAEDENALNITTAEHDADLNVGVAAEENVNILDGNEADLSYKDMLVTLPKVTRKLWINYARRAKRVDVRRLKEDMWRNLTKNHKGQKVNGQIKFSDSVGKTAAAYPEEMQKDITSPFYFLCLLHLATEHTLQVENAAAPSEQTQWSDLTISQI